VTECVSTRGSAASTFEAIRLELPCCAPYQCPFGSPATHLALEKQLGPEALRPIVTDGLPFRSTAPLARFVLPTQVDGCTLSAAI